MNFAQQQNTNSRFTGFVVVVIIHVLLAWAIASGLARKVVEKVAGPIETKVIEEVKKPPPPPEALPPPPPQLKAPPPPFIPPPEVQVTAPAPAAPVISQSSAVAPPADIRPVQAPVVAAPPPPPARPAGPVRAGVACSKLVPPEVPGVSWSGQASFVITANIKNGRVALPVEVTSVNMRGGNDRKAQRAMVQAIEAAMSGYECQGSDIQIRQEFVFNIE